MKKIYAYFCLLFVGSLIPFLIVEFYFQDYYTIGIIALLASVILTVCVVIEYLKRRSIRSLEVQSNKIDYLNWVQKEAETGKAATYYFRNRFN